jgi:hypothetical protein
MTRLRRSDETWPNRHIAEDGLMSKRWISASTGRDLGPQQEVGRPQA